jgi:UDP-3-O-[3-hydroxymyristoyl] glucosamine N-acyltransferase
MKVIEIANLFNLKIVGDPNREFIGVANLEFATENDLTFYGDVKYKNLLEKTKSKCIIVKNDFIDFKEDVTYLLSDRPYVVFLMIIDKFFKPKIELSGIDETSFIPDSAVVGDNVAIGRNVVVGQNSKIGANTIIFHNTVIGNDVEIGQNCLIYPNVYIGDRCKIGNNVILYSGVVIGSDGFGYLRDENGNHVKIPQIGNVIIEDYVEIGANSCIDRAALGSTIIKKGTKIDNLVQVAHNVIIGQETAISSQSGIAGSTKIGSYCTFGGQVGIADHVTIGDKVILGAQSGVSKSLKGNNIYMGTPAREYKKYVVTETLLRNLEQLFEKIKILEEKVNKK